MSDENKKQIETFMQDVLFIDEVKGEICTSLRNIIKKTCPMAKEEIKYGGLVFNIATDLICGIFLRQKHISLEFSYGHSFSDSENHLEGSGKYRRHLKILKTKDISDKKAEYYIKQAFGVK